MENNNNGFSYTYSAKEQAEIKNIRDKYTVSPKDGEDKMAKLRRLDASVTEVPQILSLTLGIVGVLLLGFGMSLIMTELAAMLGMTAGVAIAVGISVGIIGGVIAGFAYPVYNLLLRRRREKLAPEILRLTDELMK